MWVRQNPIIEVVRSTVPESLWPEVVRKLDGQAGPAEPLDDRTEVAEDEPYYPLQFTDADDDYYY